MPPLGDEAVGHRVAHRALAALLQEDGDLADGQLLDHFLAHHDETAFEALVRRHGPMVMGVCRRVLRNSHDAEDAFQATFLVLVRKAASVVPREMVGNWLYGVAYRTALGAKTACARRRAKEREMPRREALDEDIWSKLRPLLDHELSHLPDKYRVPIVLCDLESKSRKEAARQLGWSEGTLSGRLARARILLARRLSARGLTLSGGALAAALAGNTALASVPSGLLMSMVKAATLLASGSATAAAAVSVKVAVLMQGVLRAMVMTKVKTALVCLIAVGVMGGGIGAINYSPRAAAQTQAIPPAPAPAKAQEPLPPLASAGSPRRIESTDILNIKLLKTNAKIPAAFLGRHPVQVDGTIFLGEGYSLSVRGQTLEQSHRALAHLYKRWFMTDSPIEEIKKDLQITLVPPLEPAKPREFCVRPFIMEVEGMPAASGSREIHRLVSRPTLLVRNGQEGTCSIGQNIAPAAPLSSPAPERMMTGLSITVKISEWDAGKLQLDTKFEARQVERNDKNGAQIAIRAVCAVDLVDVGESVKIALKNDKGEVTRYAVLMVSVANPEAVEEQAGEFNLPRVGEIKVIGNTKIPGRLISEWVPLVPGSILRDADLRRAEENLIRLGLFEVNAKKNIRPTVTAREVDDESGFKDIVVRVKEK